VIKVTETITNASLLGILLSILIVGQANVHITTINISPTKAARGIFIIKAVPKTTNNIKNILAEIPESLFLHPFEILIIDCHIIAQPHIEPKSQQVIFAIHCHIASLLAFHLVLVISSIKVKVIRLSVNQIIAKIKEYGKTTLSTSKKLSVIFGI
jgi:hypothetical protein